MTRLFLTVSDLCAILEAPLVGGTLSLLRHRVCLCFDSRQIATGEIFWALAGQKFDAHQFIPSVMEKGALMCVMNQSQVSSTPVSVYIPVPNTAEALVKLARGYQRRFSLRKIAITGSNGKTTTKDMLHSILSRKFSTLATEGNYNNQIGVPMTLFRLKHSHEVAVVEIGTNAPGEIRPLSMAVEPNIAVITNVGYSHLEGLGTLENVFHEKVSISAGLLHGGTLFVNADDPQLSRLRSTSRYRVITFGVRRGQYKPQNLVWGDDACAAFRIGRTKFHLSVPGIHNLYNALAAIAVSDLMRIPKCEIALALEQFRASRMRMEILACKGFQLVADCYNANPSSMSMALETVGSVRASGRRIAVLGDMLELGERSEALHFDMGKKVPQMNFDLLCTFGTLSSQIRAGAIAAGLPETQALHFASRTDIVEFLQNELCRGDVVLV
ncbi:MAG TPA: UDP-N-acetylmuramoyl-tripeptide--D-alanyl-D-alanine ligase, partial [Fibrobacteraceae bacterium]|nr:UDP-N-acetylmuramoyl-tripeptide--D-alanyl-D-alanine ligase [Fibrobacteraceae bacterium]